MFSFASNSQTVDCAYPIIKEQLPQSSLGYNTNTVYPQFPPIMADGRSLVSSWQPESAANDHLLKTNDIKSNWEYRKYLTQHGYKVMEYNFKETCNDTGYFIPPAEVGHRDKNAPHLYSSFNDNSKPVGYQESDLKSMYLSKEQLNSRKVAPTVMTQEQILRNSAKR